MTDVDLGDTTWQYRLYEQSDGAICVGYFSPTQAGGHCYVTGDAVEATRISSDGHEVLLGVARSATGSVDVSTPDGETIQVDPQPLPKFGLDFFHHILA